VTRHHATRLAAAALAVAWSVAAQAATAPYDPTPLAIGAKAPDFALPGVDGEVHKLADFADAKVLVVAFTCNHCPTAQAYEGRIARLHEEYKDKGVAVVAISPNDPRAVRLDELGYTDVGDSYEDMVIRAEERGFTFPYLFDGETQSVAKAYGVLATPHIFIFDKDRVLRYQGRFDDAEVRKPIKSHDALNAVRSLLDDKPVPVATTRVFGCSTKWADKRPDAAASLAKWDAEPVTLEPIGLDAVAELRKNDTKDLILVNLWATWCAPCLDELPEFVILNRMYRKRPFRMVTISLDEPSKGDDVLETLRENKVASANYILNTDDRDAFAAALDQEWPGPVPYTLLIAPGGKVIYRKVGEIEPLELRRAIVNYLGRTY